MGVVVSETLILERSARLITRSFLVHALLYFLLKLGTRELRAVPVNHLGAKPRLPCPYCVSAARLSPDDQSLLPSRGGGLPSFPAGVSARGAQSDWTAWGLVESLLTSGSVSSSGCRDF